MGSGTGTGSGAWAAALGRASAGAAAAGAFWAPLALRRSSSISRMSLGCTTNFTLQWRTYQARCSPIKALSWHLRVSLIQADVWSTGNYPQSECKSADLMLGAAPCCCSDMLITHRVCWLYLGRFKSWAVLQRRSRPGRRCPSRLSSGRCCYCGPGRLGSCRCGGHLHAHLWWLPRLDRPLCILQ